MLKKGLLQICFLLFSIVVIGQVKFEPGYYIKESGEKIEGYILNIDWKNNPTSFNFKETAEGDDVEISIEDALEYGVDGFSAYQRHVVKVDQSLNNRTGLSSERNPNYKEETLFLKILVDSNIGLLKYESNQYVRFFYREGKNVPVQLIYKKYYKTSDRIAENVDFQQQIKNLAGQTFMSASKVNSLKYTEKSLVQVFKDINVGQGAEYTSYSSERVHLIPIYSFVVGSRYLNNEIKNSSSNFKGTAAASLSYLLGGEVKIVLPFRKDTWSVYMGLYYHNLSGMRDIDFVSQKIPQSQGILDIKYNTLELNLGFRQRFFANSKPKYYFFGAGSLNIAMQRKFEILDYIDLEPNTSLNYNVGIGCNIVPSFTIEISYATPRNYLNSYTFWDTEQQGVGLLLKYQL
ncbi:hypothetical protein [Portibacter lacus]|uniref:Outer membrane protein beta-barrel domain-containing protein n=1 Tax=Portibacter lacus TaxID=1099794 RepID=A0AA37SJS3_9BACT|nr:hypothetical protein [Portibacter lacus]GLR15811.1 hypothetical protein GCM10007940_04260 [Portibacter lacus]